MSFTVKRSLAGFATLSAAAILIAACGSSGGSGGGTAVPAPAASSTSAVTLETHAGALGTFLTDQTGRTVYLWQGDGDTSECVGACATAWPPLTVPAGGSAGAAAPVTGSLVSTITRADGSRQVTYKGHPLYHFIKDTAAGDTNGQGANAFGAKWFVVTTVGAADTASGAAATTPPAAGGYGY